MNNHEEEKISSQNSLPSSSISENETDPLWIDFQKEQGYKLIKRIGEGSYGVVYKAQCQ